MRVFLLLFLLIYGSMTQNSKRILKRTFFTSWAIHAKRQVILFDFLDIVLPGLFRSRGWKFLCEKLVSYPSVFIWEFYSNINGIVTFVPRFTTTFRGTCIIVTLELISEVLHVPMVDHPDYLGFPRLKALSRNELATCFYESPMSYEDRLNFDTYDLAKNPLILNMVMTFIFTLWSHYKTITKPRTQFPFSLPEDLSI